ncbi:hypothetical protein FQN55_005008 [Onygenales sp. PD_40]|nr:hypothetical protein FQN55_005008 [Onygenales sp. PD_40]
MARHEPVGDGSPSTARQHGTEEKQHEVIDHEDEEVDGREASMVEDGIAEHKGSRPGSQRHNEGDLESTSIEGTNSYSDAVKVPRNKMRGLLARFSVLPEVKEPKKYPRRTKWMVTFIVAIGAAAAPFGSAIFYPALGQVASSLNATPTVTNLSITLYMLSTSIFPLWWSSFSETFGRRSIYIISFTLFNVFNILSAVSTSIQMLIVMRLLSGGASASVQAIGAGTIADIWEPRERGRAMGIFYLGPLCGPLLAPIIGGAISQPWGWRSTQWFLTIYGGVTLLMIIFALPETLVFQKDPIAEVETNTDLNRPLSRVSSRQVVQNTAKWLKISKMWLIDPLKIVLYLRFPAVLLTVLCASIAFGSLYMLNISLQDTFSRSPYSFSVMIVGLLYIPTSIGYIIASVFGGMWSDFIMRREAKRANRIDENGGYIYRPEDRMRENAYAGALIYPAALIWYGWSVEKQLFWAVPVVANFFFGLGSMIIFSLSTTMLTEFMPKKSSTGVAVNNFMRNIFSCVGGTITAPVIRAIGNGWLFTIVGLLAFTSVGAIWSMRRFGAQWRVAMEAKMG